ncbi:Tachykinin-like peptides receptor 86C [Gryllus bimaculatus]|nr:Tachykinin-like peptides receptor 86C [Gryllus bimaculatus]
MEWEMNFDELERKHCQLKSSGSGLAAQRTDPARHRLPRSFRATDAFTNCRAWQPPRERRRARAPVMAAVARHLSTRKDPSVTIGSSSPYAHRHQLLPGEPVALRLTDGASQLRLQLRLHAEFGLAVRARVLLHQQLRGQRDSGRQRLHPRCHLARQVVRMFILVVSIFALCWLPYHGYFIYAYHNQAISTSSYVQHLYLAFYWLAMANAMVSSPRRD